MTQIVTYIELGEVFIEAGYFLIFESNQLVKFNDFVLGLNLLLLVLAEHYEQGVKAFIARVSQVLDDLLRHLDFDLVVLKLGSQLLSILDESSEVLLLEAVSVVQEHYVLPHDLEFRRMEA
jgi:hypothetical protein